MLAISNSNSIFAPIGEKSIYQQVVDRIRIAIFRGDLKPGDRLPSEPELAAQLKVGRSAVREAIRILVSTGFLVVRRGYGGGTFVQERDINSLIPVYADLLRMALVEVEELTRTRVVLESVVIRQAARNMTPEALAELYDNVDRAEDFYRRGERARRVETNLEFHTKLARVAGSMVLELNVGAVLKLLSYYLEAVPPSAEMVEGTLSGHRQLLNLIEKGDVEEAVRLNRTHVDEVSRKLALRAAEDAEKGIPARHLFDGEEGGQGGI